MTENFNQLRNYLRKKGIPDFKRDAGDKHFVIELMRRGKDNPDLAAANYHFKNYYIDSLEKFDIVKDEIVFLCNALNCRAYISVNVKSYTQVLKDTVAESARRVALGDYKKPYAIYESCSGKSKTEEDSVFIVDVDENMRSVDEYLEIIMQCRPFKYFTEDARSDYDVVPTKSGSHIIIRGFDVADFTKKVTQLYGSEFVPDIKKNHLTLLYENIQ